MIAVLQNETNPCLGNPVRGQRMGKERVLVGVVNCTACAVSGVLRKLYRLSCAEAGLVGSAFFVLFFRHSSTGHSEQVCGKTKMRNMSKFNFHHPTKYTGQFTHRGVVLELSKHKQRQSDPQQATTAAA